MDLTQANSRNLLPNFADMKANELDMVHWLNNMSSGGLLDTKLDTIEIQTIAYFLAGRLSESSCNRVLIVCDHAVLDRWFCEVGNVVYRYGKNVRVHLINGSMPKAQREKVLNVMFASPGKHIVVTPVSMVTNMLELFAGPSGGSTPRGQVGYNYVLLVESNKLLNKPKSEPSKALHFIQADHRVLLTGNNSIPSSNTIEYWRMMNWVFAANLNDIQSGKELIKKRLAKCKKYTNAMLQNLTDMVTFKRQSIDQFVLWVPLATQQRAIYKSYVSGEAYTENLTDTLRAICRHPLLLNMNGLNAPEMILNPLELYKKSVKLRILTKLIKRLLEASHKVLVLSNSSGIIDIIQRVLQDTKVGILSKRSMPEIGDINAQVTLGHSKTIRSELTKRCEFDRIIVFDPSDRPHDDRDAVVHVRKFSQANSVIVYRLLLSSCIEENAYLHQYCGELTAGGNDTLLGDIAHCRGMAVVQGKGCECVDMCDLQADVKGVLGCTKHDDSCSIRFTDAKSSDDLDQCILPAPSCVSMQNTKNDENTGSYFGEQIDEVAVETCVLQCNATVVCPTQLPPPGFQLCDRTHVNGNVPAVEPSDDKSMYGSHEKALATVLVEAVENDTNGSSNTIRASYAGVVKKTGASRLSVSVLQQACDATTGSQAFISPCKPASAGTLSFSPSPMFVPMVVDNSVEDFHFDENMGTPDVPVPAGMMHDDKGLFGGLLREELNKPKRKTISEIRSTKSTLFYSEVVPDNSCDDGILTDNCDSSYKNRTSNAVHQSDGDVDEVRVLPSQTGETPSGEWSHGHDDVDQCNEVDTSVSNGSSIPPFPVLQELVSSVADGLSVTGNSNQESTPSVGAISRRLRSRIRNLTCKPIVLFASASAGEQNAESHASTPSSIQRHCAGYTQHRPLPLQQQELESLSNTVQKPKSMSYINAVKDGKVVPKTGIPTPTIHKIRKTLAPVVTFSRDALSGTLSEYTATDHGTDENVENDDNTSRVLFSVLDGYDNKKDQIQSHETEEHGKPKKTKKRLSGGKSSRCVDLIRQSEYTWIDFAPTSLKDSTIADTTGIQPDMRANLTRMR